MSNKFNVVTDFVEDWLVQDRKKHLMLDKKTQAVFLHVFETFKSLGPVDAREKLPRTRTKFLFEEIWEIRVEQFRIAYFWHGSACVLLHGIKKKQDKWSLSDRDIAKKRKAAYLAEQKNID